jgi:hypothetical protein
MSCSSQSSWFYHPNDTWCGVRSIKLLVMLSSLLPCYLIPLGSKYVPHGMGHKKVKILHYILLITYYIINSILYYIIYKTLSNISNVSACNMLRGSLMKTIPRKLLFPVKYHDWIKLEQEVVWVRRNVTWLQRSSFLYHYCNRNPSIPTNAHGLCTSPSRVHKVCTLTFISHVHSQDLHHNVAVLTTTSRKYSHQASCN